MHLLRCTLPVLLLCILITACSQRSASRQPAQLPESPQLVTINKNWDTYVGFGPSYRDYRWRPAQDTDYIYTISKQGEIFQVDKVSGTRTSIAEFGTEITGGLTLVQSQILLFGNIHGELIAYNLASGDTLWTLSLGSETLHPPVSNGRLVAVKTNDGKLWGIELATGIIAWTTITKNPPLTTRTQSEPVFAAGVVFSTFDTGKIAVINPQNGARVWEAAMGEGFSRNEIQQITDGDANPLVLLPYFYSVSLHGTIQAHLLRPDGLPELLWKRPFSSHVNIASDDSNLYLVNDRSLIYAYRRDDGKKVWHNDQMRFRSLGSPVRLDDYLIVADGSGHLFALHPKDGTLLGSYRTSPYAITSQIIYDTNQIYLLDNGGYLSAITIQPASG